MTPIRTLFVAPQVPWPLDAGSKIRTHQLLRCYREISEVTLVCFAQDDAEAANIQQLDKLVARVFCVPFSPSSATEDPRTGRLKALAQVLRVEPQMTRYMTSPVLARHIQTLVAGEHFDLIHIERLSMINNVRLLLTDQRMPHSPFRILDVDDLESTKMQRLAALLPWHSKRKYLALLESVKLAALERRVLPWFDKFLVCSERDKTKLTSTDLDLPVEIFRNGAEVESRIPESYPPDEGLTLLYLGAMSYAPNEDAVLYFMDSILPLIRRRVPSVRFVVAGKGPSQKVLALNNGTDVVVTGYVKDVTAALRSCSVCVVPLRLSGGTRIKILEAMAVGTPVVSTSVGCEGIDVTANENILVADSAEAFANACVELLLDGPKRRALAQAGQRLVLRNYQWRDIRSNYVERLIEDLETADHATSPKPEE